MATQIQLNAHQIRDLRIVLDLGADRLASIAEHISGLSPVPLKPSELLREVTKQLDGDSNVAEKLMRLALSLNVLMRQTGIEVDAILTGVRFGITEGADWTQQEITGWTAVEAKFRELLCAAAFRLTAKAIDLSYEYANLFRRARILTDIRPLFTNDAASIEGAVVSYTLRLRYDSVEGEHALSIAMDEGDVRNLAEQCARALTKARTAQVMMRSKIEIPTIVTGESDNG